MYLKNYEIKHLRENHPSLLGQINGHGLTRTKDRHGYDTTFDMSSSMFKAITKALENAVDTRRARK